MSERYYRNLRRWYFRWVVVGMIYAIIYQLLQWLGLIG